MLSGIAELTIRSFSLSSTSANLFSAILWKSVTALCLWFVSSQTAGTANPMRVLWPLNNELQRAKLTFFSELTIRSFSFSSTSANLFSAILWKSVTALCLWFVSSQTAGTANPMRILWPLNNELQRAPVNIKCYLASRGLCFSNSLYNIVNYYIVAKGQRFSRNLIGSVLIGYQVISPSLTISGIQIVNIENKFCEEITILGYCGAFQCFCSVHLQINLATFSLFVILII